MRMPATNNTTCGCGLSGVRIPAAYSYPSKTITLGAIPALLMTPLTTLASIFALALIGGRGGRKR